MGLLEIAHGLPKQGFQQILEFIMSLVSTLVKLEKQGATVFRVDFPEAKFAGSYVPPHSEHFATMRQATHSKELAEAFMVGEITITPVAAASLNPLTTY